MAEKKDIFDEARELISEGQDEISEEKKIVYDKITNQSSIKIPKSISLKAGINENSMFKIVFNPKEDTLKKLNKAKFLIYLKEVENGDKKET